MSDPLTKKAGRREAQASRNLIAHLCDADAHPNTARTCNARAAVTVNDLTSLEALAVVIDGWATP